MRTRKILFFLLCVVLAGSVGATNVPVVAISASGDDGNVARNIIDGNLSTRWSCPIPPGVSCWIQADLGTVRDLATIGIGWYQGNTRSNTFSIRTSDDGQVFSTVLAGTSTGSTTALETYGIAPAHGRYVRIYVTDNSLHNGWASITELVIAAPTSVVLPISSITALANDGNGPQNAVDGNLSTRWSCAIPPSAACWLQADLGTRKTITALDAAWYQGNARSNKFTVGSSDDGSTFTTTYAGTSSGKTTAMERYEFPPVLARYVRIAVNDNSLHNGWASITEIEVMGYAVQSDAGGLDIFTIRKIYASAPSGIQWNSQHWGDGHTRDVFDRDPDDPTQVSQQRGDSSRLYVDGQGILRFFGTGPNLPEPRLYLNDPAHHFFKNVELTLYYQRISDDKTPWGGIVLGARSGPDGHSSNGDPCDAHTYYGRFRHDGNKDFEKELKHPDSLPERSANIWGGAVELPYAQWIGMKFVIYNINNNTAVKMELYRDLTGGVNGGAWEKIDEIIDGGGWTPPQSGPACGYPSDFIPTTGGGVIILRDTGTGEAQYKWFSAREITPPVQ